MDLQSTYDKGSTPKTSIIAFIFFACAGVLFVSATLPQLSEAKQSTSEAQIAKHIIP